MRRTLYDLKKAEERAHLLLGLAIALANLDQVIAIIRKSKDPEEAKSRLTQEVTIRKETLEEFLGALSLDASASARSGDGLLRLDATQAQAILDMRLQRLTGLEREKIVAEFREVLAAIADLKDILAKSERVSAIIRAELSEIKETFGRARRTEIVAEAGDLAAEDLIAEEEVVLTISRGGYAKRTPLSIYRAQKRGGKGRMGAQTKEEDVVEHLFVGSTHDYLLAFTNKGRVHWVKLYDVPSGGPATRGKALVNLLALEEGERVAAMATTRTFPDDLYLLFATKRGLVKKTVLSAYGNPREKGIIAIKLDEDDELLSAQITDGTRQVFLGTRLGMGIKFSETDARPMGRDTTGVKGIELRGDDVVVEMDLVEETGTLLAVTEKGFGKRTDVAEYRHQARGGSGVINVRVTEKNGPVVGNLVRDGGGPSPRDHGAGHPHPPRGRGREGNGPRGDGRQAHRPRRRGPGRRRGEAGRARRGVRERDDRPDAARPRRLTNRDEQTSTLRGLHAFLPRHRRPRRGPPRARLGLSGRDPPPARVRRDERTRRAARPRPISRRSGTGR